MLRISSPLIVFGAAFLSSTPATFREVPPSESKIAWRHDNARSEKRYLPETVGPGVAIFDYNNDGWMDLLFLNSGESVFFRPARMLRSALYRNNQDGSFTDVSEEAGLTANLFGMGAAIADYDGDGFQDVFLTGFDQCILYHNSGDGTFKEVTAKSGIDAPGWSTSALWFDYNNDSRLDLFVCQFADYSSLKSCGIANSYGGRIEGLPESQSSYCFPAIFPPRPSHLYRNEGNGRFTDVSKETGILDSLGKAFGVVATDVNQDGYMDLFLASDTAANALFVNRGGKRFEEAGLAAGIAYSEHGAPRSGMGVDAADFDQDGRQDLFVANVDQENFSLYHNNGDESFTDLNRDCGIAEATRLLSGWGLRFFDFDNDGMVDLMLANGHPNDLVDQRMQGVTYKEPLLLFHNEGQGRLINVSQTAGQSFQKRYPARGLAVGDLNNDGFLDVVVGINGGPPLVLFNNLAGKRNWVGLNLVGQVGNPASAGALVTWSADGQTHSRLITAGGSFLSSHDPRVILGIGTSSKADWLEIRWPKPSTRVERFTMLPINRYLTVTEGTGVSQ
ncbi:MAG: CRTAC1 family protein [Acidobacteriota bacterium]